ncbi:DotU/TssL family secretion system protein [Variovorax sp. YR216]|uniref:DotU/TssL family secretion system protein n=1 Tax=Variovorax sp. YR216 TaxID=1882828 RepID=UPI00089AB368|nr:DotU/TssL family secretion system protein [Variovorax sp. YR216]SEB09594.1 type VI secretion system protein ImpK [Variovorax sp. YR216]
MRTGAAPASPGNGAPDGANEPAAARALRVEALPLVALLSRLRDSAPVDPAELRRTLSAAVAHFEAHARVAGIDEASVAAASYVLCAWGDEQIGAAPWGGGAPGLLQRFHGEADGGDKLLRLLSRLAEKPREHRALLELFHTCLSLGLRAGMAPDGRDHEILRTRVHLALEQASPVPALVAPWHCAPAAASPPKASRVALPAVLLLGVLAVGIYTASQLQLAARVDGVLASLQRLLPAPAVAAQPAAGAVTVPPRLAASLRDDIDAGRLSVRDETLRSVVVIGANALGDATGPLERLGSALKKVPGKVLVVGYTDGSDPPTARTPSAWHQAMEWARATADVLRPQLGDERLAVEARVDATAGAPLRRVEIVLFPE